MQTSTAHKVATPARASTTGAADAIEVGVDGSALGNPTGAAGWCWYVSPSCWSAGGWESGSNNLGELEAVHQLLQATAHLPKTKFVVYADSRYVIQTLDSWVHSWMRKAATTGDPVWKTAGGQPVKNADLIRSIVRLRARRDVKFVWVKGHAGHHLNEGADSGAFNASQAIKARRPVNPGPGWTL